LRTPDRLTDGPGSCPLSAANATESGASWYRDHGPGRASKAVNALVRQHASPVIMAGSAPLIIKERHAESLKTLQPVPKEAACYFTASAA
jgi:hypothetical protein